MPRSGATWAMPNRTPWSAMARGGFHRPRKPRSTMPRKITSSTSGATTTARISIAITYPRSSPLLPIPSVLLWNGTFNDTTTMPTTICVTKHAIQVTGPHARSIGRINKPTSSAGLPRPHFLLAQIQKATGGP